MKRRCTYCGDPFEARTAAKFCSDECRLWARAGVSFEECDICANCGHKRGSHFNGRGKCWQFIDVTTAPLGRICECPRFRYKRAT